MFKHYGPQLIFLIFLFLFLELTVMPFTAVKGARPDLFFILAAFYGLLIYPNRTPHFSVLLGLVRELFSGTVLGFETFAYGISGLVLWFLVTKMERENPYNQAVLVFFYSFVNLLLVSVLEVCLRQTALGFLQLLTEISAISLYTTLLSPVVFWMMKRFLKIRQRGLFGGTF
jgi:rod shape-determining protein MreD